MDKIMDSMYEQLDFFNAFLENTTEKAIFIEAFAKKFHANGPTQFLDLGCNAGVLSMKLMNSIQEQLAPGSSLVGVDPSKNAIDAFSQKTLPQNLSGRFYAETAEDFFTMHPQTFDWVIASHCLYWSDDLADTVHKILQSAPSGVIVMRGDYGVNQLQVEFEDMLGEPKGYRYVADDVEDILLACDTHFTREDHESRIQIPPHDSQLFRELIAFCLLTTNEQLDQDGLDRVSRYLRPYGDELRHDVSFFWFDQL